jgi:hypothetical protein
MSSLLLRSFQMNMFNSYRSGMLVVLLYDMKSEIKILRIKKVEFSYY